MAVDNTKKSFAKMEFPLTIKRQDAFSLDGTETWKSMAEAEEYAKSNPTAYVGQEFPSLSTAWRNATSSRMRLEILRLWAQKRCRLHPILR